ncbi:MAG: hypothetical protein IJ313_05170 [Clostridia bacterium]|nr:hypothetical protein [Clostridia bacterium]
MLLGRLFNKQEEIKKKIIDKTFSPKMSICMLGARGVGKTSVITSMYNGQKEAVEGTDLFLIAQGTTDSILRQKRECLKEIFSGYHEADEFVKEGGIAGDSKETTFSFTYGMNSANVNIGLEIRDYPGEYLLSNPQTVAEYVRQADAVLVAIDTPCLMEENGIFNEGKNRPKLVSQFLMENLPQGEEKLVLFVPLKCERYANDGRLDEVKERICEVYAELLEYLRDRQDQHGLKKKICCAITPIKTLGGVEFDSFEYNFDGTVNIVELADGSLIPAGINYRFVSTDAQYAPENCEQPLYYLLGFFSKQYEIMRQEQSKSGLMERLRKFLSLVPHMDEFRLEAAKLSLRRSDCGVQNPVLFGKGRI